MDAWGTPIDGLLIRGGYVPAGQASTRLAVADAGAGSGAGRGVDWFVGWGAGWGRASRSWDALCTCCGTRAVTATSSPATIGNVNAADRNMASQVSAAALSPLSQWAGCCVGGNRGNGGDGGTAKAADRYTAGMVLWLIQQTFHWQTARQKMVEKLLNEHRHAAITSICRAYSSGQYAVFIDLRAVGKR